jgi:hypothetical protein
MTFQQFTTLSQHIQLRNLILDGEYISDRVLDEHHVLLFQRGRFYVEVMFNPQGDEVLSTRSFDNVEELDPYLQEVRLPRFIN